jgi:hypothetical protein
MPVFTADSDFIESDNRRERVVNPVSAAQMNNKHEALFPEEMVRGKSVLDLGCCIGATGHWCLSLGAASYTGVELQAEYATTARTLLEKHHPGKAIVFAAPIETWLATNQQAYDVVAALGVIYVFTDYYSVLANITRAAKETVAIEALYHDVRRLGEEFSGVMFVDRQSINLADENASLFGKGTRISPNGLRWLMRDFGFETPGLIKPRPLESGVDVYNEDLKKARRARYLMRFTRTGTGEKSLSEDLRTDRAGAKLDWDKGG